MYWHQATSKWCADVCLGGKRFYKLFEDFDEACGHVREARENIFNDAGRKFN
ncbi:hypothetical protein [Paenibacillus koleovorans]|uniref:hypothetical protein n=1 Tax=Paenibacillus koleovorans TaxID=121608 RepID=UPI0013E2C541|nr:hypothetical protein [Paenibacillus koleovorans]